MSAPREARSSGSTRRPGSLHSNRPGGGPPIHEDVRREIDSHIDMLAEELEAAGWDAGSAREEALRRFGERTEVEREMAYETREHDRARRRTLRLAALAQDSKFALRSFARDRGFTAMSVLTIALGIGAVSTLYTVVQGVLLDPLPFEDPSELVYVEGLTADGRQLAASDPDFLAWEEQAGTLDDVFAYISFQSTALRGSEVFRTRISRVSRGFWGVLQPVVVRGRALGPDDHRQYATPAVVVSEGFWRQRLGAPDRLDGVTINALSVEAEVVGVMRSGFDYPTNTDVWAPWELGPRNNNRTSHNWTVLGRLRDGVTRDEAARELSAILQRLPQEGSPDFIAVQARVVPMADRVVGEVRAPLLLLLGASAFVLLVACTNLASALLARGQVRLREIAVRRSLGAGRGRIIRQLLTESVVLAVAGGLVGLAISAVLLRTLPGLAGDGIPRIDNVGLDPVALGVSALIIVAAGLLFGLLPALGLTRIRAVTALRSGGRTNAARRGRIWSVLVGAEVALSMVLLIGSGLLLKSLLELASVDPGFETDHALAAHIHLPGSRYGDNAARSTVYESAVRRLSALPGVQAVGAVSSLPFAAFDPTGMMAVDTPDEVISRASYRAADAGYFAAMGIPLVAGRLADSRDGPQAPHVAVVSQSFADEVWPGENPLGRRLTGGGMDSFWAAEREDYTWATVIGVVGDVLHDGPEDRGRPTVYFPISQRSSRLGSGTLVLRGTTSPTALVSSARAALAEVAPDVAVEFEPLPEIVSASVADRRFTVLLLGVFALTGLLLAAVGIYGVVSYSVARRTREVGIRLALGASPGQMRAMVLRDTLRMVGSGLAVGLLGAFLLSRVIQALLFGVEALDPVVFIGMSGVLLLTGLAAGFIPARRSTRGDPMRAILAE